MRLICSSTDRQLAEQFYRFLLAEGIEASYESLSDARSEQGTYQIWVIQEDDVERASHWYREFAADPNDPRFSTTPQDLFIQTPEKKKAPEPIIIRPVPRQAGTGPLTLSILFLCIAIFLLEIFGAAAERQSVPSGHQPPLAGPVYRTMFFDYPRYFELVDLANKRYSIDELSNFQSLPAEARELNREILQSPYWQGVYPVIVRSLRNEPQDASASAPWMEKIRQGELWRLLSPAFMHATGFPLHIFFNMIWLVMLGSQMERRLSPVQYLGFIVLAGVFANICQYIMGGAQFLGYSGVVLAKLAFVWTRIQRAPWEGYVIPPGTVLFVGAFVLIFVGWQCFIFIQEVTSGSAMGSSMANTAHLAGAFSGWVLAHSKLFRARI